MCNVHVGHFLNRATGIILYFIYFFTGDRAEIAFSKKPEPRQRGVHLGQLPENATDDLHRPPRHDQPSALSRYSTLHVVCGAGKRIQGE